MSNIDEKFQALEKRIETLEKIVLTKDTKKWKKSYSGLHGGIRLLIDNKFFNSPKNLKEVEFELKREGYHYPKPSVSKALSVDFTNKQKILNRIKNKTNWLYIIRK